MKVTVEKNERGTIYATCGSTFWIGNGFEDRAKPGDEIELLGAGDEPYSFGYVIQGIVVNGVVLWHRTKEEAERIRQEQIADYQSKEEEAEARSRAEYAARLALDPLSFDWDREGPSEKAAAALNHVTSEDEFPQSYAGQGWQYAYRLWVITKADPDLLDGLGSFDDVPGVVTADLGLTGFMEGWARNAVRQMRGKLPRANGAIITVGEGEDAMYPSVGSAEQAMKRAIG